MNPDVFGVWAKGLEFGGEVERDFGLVGAAEDFRFERASAKLGQVLGLNVLEIDKDDVCFQMAVVWFDAEGGRHGTVTGCANSATATSPSVM